MKKTISASALVTGLLVFGSANAGLISRDCTGCTTAQIEALAINCAQGSTYVHNFASGGFYKICFTYEGTVPAVVRPDLGLPRQKQYHWLTPESRYQQYFDAYENVYQNDGHSKNVTINVPDPTGGAAPSTAGEMHTMLSPASDDGYVNAYDTIVSQSDNDRVVNALMTTYFDASQLRKL